MIFRYNKSVHSVWLLIVILASIQYVTIGQWRKNIGAKIQRTPSGAATSIRYGRTSTFTPQTRYLPSEGRYISSARGLMPSESRALRMSQGPLPSSGRHSHLFPKSSTSKTIRPYSYTSITRNPKQGRTYGGSYSRSYGKTVKPYNKALTKPMQTPVKIPKAKYSKQYKPAVGTIRYGLSSKTSLTAKYKEPKLTQPTRKSLRTKKSSYIGNSIRYGKSAKNQPILKQKFKNAPKQNKPIKNKSKYDRGN